MPEMIETWRALAAVGLGMIGCLAIGLWAGNERGKRVERLRRNNR